MPRECKFQDGNGSGHCLINLCLKRPEDCHVRVPTYSWKGGKPMTGFG